MSNETYDNNSNYYQPENNNPYQQDAGNFYAPPTQAPQPPKKKKWPIAVAVLGVIAVAGAGIGSYYAFFRKPSYKDPADAVVSCIKQLDEQFSSKNLGTTQLEEKLDSSALMEGLMEKGQYMDMTLTLEDSDMDELSMFSGVSAGFSYQNDVKNSASTLGINASIMGIGGDIGLYMDSDMLAVTSEEFLSDAYLSVDTKDLVELLAESGEISEDQLEYLTTTLQQSSQLNQDFTEYVEYCMKNLPDSLKAFIKDCDIEQSEEDSHKIGDNEYECYSYDISVSAEAFKGFLEDYCSYLSEYDYEDNAFFTSISKVAAQGDDDIDINEMIQEALTELPDAIDEDSDETLDFVLHMTPNAQLLGIDLEVGEDSEAVSMELRFGGENPGQEIYFTASSENDYSDFTLDFSCINSAKKDTETALSEMSMTMDGEELMTLKIQNDYNAEDDSFESSIAANINADGENIGIDITAEGAYEDIEKGKGYTIAFDDLTIKLNGDALAEELDLPISSITFSGEITCGILEDGLDKPKGTGYNALELSEKDVNEILEILKKSQTFSYILQAVPEETIKEYINEFINETM